MRLKKLTVDGFRAFPTEISIDLDADAVVILGANGQGKTSLLDAVLWALTGRVQRLGESPDVALSKFSDSGTARVALELSTTTDAFLHVSRMFDGSDGRVFVETDGVREQGSAAEARIMSLLWRDALVAPQPLAAFDAALRRSVYLEQDRVRDFLAADDAQARFRAASELFGSGRVTELLRQLENDRKQWSTASNRLRKELEDKGEELAGLRAELDNLRKDSDLGAQDADRQLAVWWENLAIHDLPVTSRFPTLEVSRTGAMVDSALRDLDESRLRMRRQIDNATAVLEDLSAPPDDQPPDLDQLTDRITSLRNELEATQELLTAAEERAELIRIDQLRDAEARNELALMAEMALRHLDDLCPVCQQEFDRESTAARLEELSGFVDHDALDRQVSNEVDELRTRVVELTMESDRAETALVQARNTQRAWHSWRVGIFEKLGRLGIDSDVSLEQLASSTELQQLASSTTELIEDLQVDYAAISSLREEGEQLALLVARLHETARQAEISDQIDAAAAEYYHLERQLATRDQAGVAAENIINALRNTSERVVERRLQAIEPLLARIYARIDPHVEFRAVRFLTKYPRGRGHLNAELRDFADEFSVDSPETVLSSSQLNALAVSIFLAFSLGIESLPLHVTMLDDPLQSLDDVNLLGLVDTLRRTRDRRQLIISTHDRRFGQLLERKLRPVGPAQRTLVIELDGWNRDGPILRQRDVPQDSESLRVVA